MARRAAAAAVAVAAAMGLPTTAAAAVVWRGDFETGDLSQWSKAQIVSAERLRVVPSPVTQGSHAVRVEVRQGDNPISASGNRNELVYLSYEPRGTERYYRWQTMFDPSYPSNATWQVFTQWHHSGDSGSPPVEFDVYGENIGLAVNYDTVWYVPLVRGVWHDFIFHVRWSPDASEGFIELWYDGQLVIPKRGAVTQFSGMTQYLKQGLYRNSSITQDGIVFHDGFVAGETLADVMPTGGNPGPADAGTPAPDAAAPGRDAAAPGPDAAVPGRDAAAPGPDAAAPGRDAAALGPDAEEPGPDPAAQGPDAGSAGLDADADAEVGADAGVEDLVDSGTGAADAATGSPDAGEPAPTVEPPTGCSSAPGGGLASLGLALGVALLVRRRRG